MKLKFKTQLYQTAAVQVVVDCFKGQLREADGAGEVTKYKKAGEMNNKKGTATQAVDAVITASGSQHGCS